MQDIEKVRRLKKQAIWLAKMIDFGPEPESRVERASGNAVCDNCGLTYFDHPYDKELKAAVTCDGRLWH